MQGGRGVFSKYTTMWLWIILFSSFCLRLWVGVHFPCIEWADNVFQSIAPAYKLVNGFGVQIYGDGVGMRSWVLPGLIAAIIKTCQLFSHGSYVYLTAIKFIVVLVSMIPVWVSYRLLSEFARPRVALLAMLIPAFWYESIYFASVTFAGAIAANLFVYAIYQCMQFQRDKARWRLVVAGLILAFVAIVRFHLIPAVLLLMLLSCRREWSAWQAFAGSFFAGFIALGLLDWWTWSYPFQSIIANVKFNIIQGQAVNQWGRQPLLFYISRIFKYTHVLFLPFLVLVCVAFKRCALLSWLMVFNLICFSVVGHKEYRFIFLALTVWPIMAALGWAMCVQRYPRWRKAFWVLVPVVLLVSLVTGVLFVEKKSDHRIMTVVQKTGALIHQRYQGKVKRVLFNQVGPEPEFSPFATGGYSYLNAHVPMVFTDLRQMRVLPQRASLPTLIITRQPLAQPHIYRVFCVDGTCLYATAHKVDIVKPALVWY